MKVAPEQELLLWWVSFLMLVYDRVGGTGPRVQIAKAAITGDYIRNTFFYRSVLAVPVSISSDAIDCAPGRIAIGSAGRSTEPHCRQNGSHDQCQCRKGFCHDVASYVGPLLQRNTARVK